MAGYVLIIINLGFEMGKRPKWLRRWQKKERNAKENWSEYQLRKAALSEIGFESYEDYLKSEVWIKIRSLVFSYSKECSCCSSTPQCVHHSAYHKKVLLGELKSIKKDLHALCHRCHRFIEFEGERKRSSGEANRVLKRLLFKKKHGMSKSQKLKIEIRARKQRRA